jgi:hypothetical protein
MPDVFSFRDPAGHIADFGDRIVRTVRRSAADDLLAFLASVSSKSFCDSGLLVRTQAAGDDATGDLLFEHERIPFVSYPYEWCPEMLHAAAELTLELAYGCIKEGFSLKDATPYNVLFRGPHPVFVDLLSFERRDPGDPTWLPYAQFVRTFLLPLLACRHLGFRLDQLMLAERDGIDPELMYRWLSWPQRLRSPFFSLVTMPKWLASRSHKAEATLTKSSRCPIIDRRDSFSSTSCTGCGDSSRKHNRFRRGRPGLPTWKSTATPSRVLRGSKPRYRRRCESLLRAPSSILAATQATSAQWQPERELELWPSISTQR